jgi:predicted metal-dependent HD superfamily phosphohydrolase
MLDRPRIFHSLWALTVGMEERARFNLAEEIKKLQV